MPGRPHGREGTAGTLPAMHAMGWIQTMRPTGYIYAPSAPRLDPDRLVGGGAERWNHAEELAWYLGLDPCVIVAEWARHLDPDVPMTVSPCPATGRGCSIRSGREPSRR